MLKMSSVDSVHTRPSPSKPKQCCRYSMLWGGAWGPKIAAVTLHAAAKSQNKMQCRFLLDVVVAQSTSVFKLLSSENKTLLVWRDTFFVLDLRLHVVDGVR